MEDYRTLSLVKIELTVAPQFMQPMCGGLKTKIAKLQIDDLSTALDIYHLEVKRYPSSAEGLAALITRPANTNGWNGPYLKKNKFLRTQIIVNKIKLILNSSWSIIATP